MSRITKCVCKYCPESFRFCIGSVIFSGVKISLSFPGMYFSTIDFSLGLWTQQQGSAPVHVTFSWWISPPAIYAHVFLFSFYHPPSLLLWKYLTYSPNLAIYANVWTFIFRVVGSSLSGSPAWHLSSRPPVTFVLHTGTIPLHMGFECDSLPQCCGSASASAWIRMILVS